MEQQGVKHDQQKLRWHLFAPLWRPLELVVRVLEHGEKKYARDNWQSVKEIDDAEGPPALRYSNALQRHIVDLHCGIRIDKDSGLPTLAHIVCDSLFLLWFQLQQGLPDMLPIDTEACKALLDHYPEVGQQIVERQEELQRLYERRGVTVTGPGVYECKYCKASTTATVRLCCEEGKMADFQVQRFLQTATLTPEGMRTL